MTCTKCDIEIPSARVELGYRECIDCSNVTAYKAHVVYPHKTGAVVEPIATEEQADHLKRLDRRSSKKGKKAYGQRASNSWDRWLEEYEKNKNKPVKSVKVYPLLTNNYMTQSKAIRIGFEKFNKLGYDRAVCHINELYADDKITLSTKSSVVSKLTSWQIIPKKQRKLLSHIV